MPLEFDPYKRPPAARLVAILVTGGLLAWVMRAGTRAQNARYQKDPEKFYRTVAAASHRSPVFDAVIAIILVTVIVFAVDALTSLFGRWLRERTENCPVSPDKSADTRAGAMLGGSGPPRDAA